MQDPLVGLTFDPARVRFEAAPEILLSAEDRSRGQWYLFAKYEDAGHGDRVFLVVSGLVSIYGDTAPRQVVAVEPDFGFLAECESSKCRVLGTPDRIFGDLPVPEYVVHGLVADAVSRMIAAFGGLSELQRSFDEFSSRVKNRSMEAELLRAFQRAGLSMEGWAC
jgi:hypothetical protein